MADRLKIVIFYGSTRTGRLVERVGAYVRAAVEAEGMEPIVLDPQEIPCGLLKQPLHFFPSPSEAPAWMNEVNSKITAADGFIIVSPQYNAGIPAALSNMMDHFPPLSYRHRPVGLVNYSMGQFGGCRVTVQLRSYTAEMGMLPIPTTVVIPTAHNVFDPDGTCKAERTANKVEKLVNELKWYATALKNQTKLLPLTESNPQHRH